MKGSGSNQSQRIRGTRCLPFDSRLLQFCTEKQAEVYRCYGESGSIVNEAARRLGKDVSAVSKAVRVIQDKARKVIGKLEWDDERSILITRSPDVLLFDIETAPNISHVWNFWNQNIGHNQVLEYGFVMSFACKWFGEDEVHYYENRTNDDSDIIKKLIEYFDKADVVIAHNGKAFDVKTVKARAVSWGVEPPSPFKIIDTFLVCKKEFKFPRNSLEYVAEALGVGEKYSHKQFPGHELWVECLRGNDEAWAEMRHYNMMDVDVLEQVYIALRPWISDHPNLGILLEDDRHVCPKCGSGELLWEKRPATTNTGKYRLFRCSNCKGFGRTRYTELDKEKRKALTTNAT